jgi:uncharacterized protein YbaP (TraB family)
MRTFPRLAAWMLCIAGTAAAQAPEPAAPVAQMETVVVTGEQPGPGLWKVSKGDHVLWVLGTLTPLPKNMTWQSKEVEALIAQSQAVIAPPEVEVKADTNFFGRLALLPSLIGVRKNPDGKTLEEVVPADQYARWLALKARYIGRSGKIEKWRPIFAALELYDEAIEKSGLTRSNVARQKVKEAAKNAGIEPTVPRVELLVEHPRTVVREFKDTPLDDLDCFRKTLDRIDADLGAMTKRANAWATGDVEALRKLPYADQMDACKAAVTETGLARRLGVVDLEARARRAWVDEAAKALDAHRVTFAMLPIRSLLAGDGYLAELAARGYKVESPDEQAEAAPDDAADVAVRR